MTLYHTPTEDEVMHGVNQELRSIGSLWDAFHAASDKRHTAAVCIASVIALRARWGELPIDDHLGRLLVDWSLADDALSTAIANLAGDEQ